jgi:hypothetical protein
MMYCMLLQMYDHCELLASKAPWLPYRTTCHADGHSCNCIKPPEGNHPKHQKYQMPAKSASLHRAHSIFFSSSLRCSSALPLLSSIFSWLPTRFGDWRDSPVPGLQFFHFFPPPHYSSWSRFGIFNLSPFSPPPEASPTPNPTPSSLLTRRNLHHRHSFLRSIRLYLIASASQI